MDIPGFRLHALRGAERGRWSIGVNGNWCITFEFRDGHVVDEDAAERKRNVSHRRNPRVEGSVGGSALLDELHE